MFSVSWHSLAKQDAAFGYRNLLFRFAYIFYGRCEY